MAMASSILMMLLFSFLFHFVALTSAQQEQAMLASYCFNENGNYSTNGTYQANLNHLLSSFSSNTEIDYGFYNASYGRNQNKVNAMALCRGDLEPETCRDCINNSTQQITKHCPNQKEAIIWYDDCLLRYSNRSFFGKLEFPPYIMLYNKDNASDANQFNQVVGKLFDSLKNQSALGDSLRKFATGNATTPSSQRIYALAQCTPDLSERECRDCLTNATGLLPYCCGGKQGGRVVATSCNVRYEIYPFYGTTSDAPSPSPSPTPLPPPPTLQPPESPEEPGSPPPSATNTAPPPPPNAAAPRGKASNISGTIVFIAIPVLLLQYFY